MLEKQPCVWVSLVHELSLGFHVKVDEILGHTTPLCANTVVHQWQSHSDWYSLICDHLLSEHRENRSQAFGVLLNARTVSPSALEKGDLNLRNCHLPM